MEDDEASVGIDWWIGGFFDVRIGECFDVRIGGCFDMRIGGCADCLLYTSDAADE